MDTAFRLTAAAAEARSGGAGQAAPDGAARVDALYAALARGEIATVLAALAPDVAWEHGWSAQALPVRRPTRTPAEEAALRAELEELARVQVVRVTGAGGEVAALVADGFTVTLAGQAARRFEVHLWTLDEAGRVTRFRRVANVGTASRH